MDSTTCPYCKTALNPTVRINFCPACGGNLNARGGGSVNIRRVAIRQRQLLWCFLIQLVLYTLGYATASNLPPPAGPFAMLSVGIGVIVLGLAGIAITVDLLAGLGTHLAIRIVVAVFMLAPCINLLILLSANSNATRALQAAGLRVGFMGVSRDQLDRFLELWRCRNCGYDLRGNTSGRCSECGAAAIGPGAAAIATPIAPPE